MTVDGEDKKAFQAKLEGQVGKDKVSTEDDGTGSPVFWTAPLNDTQVKEFQSSSAVIATVFPDSTIRLEYFSPAMYTNNGGEAAASATSTPTAASPGTSKPQSKTKSKRAGFDTQRDAKDELKVVSQPEGIDLSSLDGYTYDSTAGEGITVYVVDTGAHIKNPDYIDMYGSKEWIIPKLRDAHPTWNENQDDPVDHGTCVISKVASKDYGVAKKANIVVVKMPSFKDADGDVHLDINADDLLKVFVAVQRDINTKERQGKAVVNMSFQCKLSSLGSCNAY